LENFDISKACSKKSEVVVLKKPLADIYIVESYKEYNYENTDRSMSNESGGPMVYSLVQRAQDMADDKCNIF